MKYKILFLFSGLPHYFNNILNNLNNYEFEIHVLVPSNNKSAIGKGVFENKDNIKFKIWESPLKTTFYRKPFYSDFDAILNTIQPDAVIFSWPYVLELALNRKLFKKLKENKVLIGLKEIPYQVPALNEIHKSILSGYYDEDLKRPNIFTRFVRTIILACCRLIYYKRIDFHLNYIDDSRRILKSYGVSDKKIFVTKNSPETTHYLSLYEKHKEKFNLNDNLILLHVGRLVKWKRVDWIINSLHFLNQNGFPNVELWVVGNGPEYQNLIDYTSTLGITNNVKFLGAKYGEDLSDIFVRAHIYVLAGAGGLSINEAMCYAKPIVCTKSDGTEKDLVINGENGYVFEYESRADLISKLKILLSDKDKIQKMGNASINIIKTKINEKVVISNYLKAFRKVMSNL